MAFRRIASPAFCNPASFLLRCDFCTAQSLPLTSGPVLPLYRALRSIGLDPQSVYKIREAAIDREDIHLWLNDGTIAFTQSVDGRITGAYFEGDGEVLVRPPDRMERASLGLFTKQGVLEEQFSSAYLRFNDDTAQELQPYLRPAEDAAAFVARNDAHVRRTGMLWTPCGWRSASPAGQPPWPRENPCHRPIGCYTREWPPIDWESSMFISTLAPRANHRRPNHDRPRANLLRLVDEFPDALGAQARLCRLPGSTAPPVRPGPGMCFRLTKYTIDVAIDPSLTLSADAELDGNRPARVGRASLMFELSRYLQLKSVEMDGKPLEFIQNEAIEGSEFRGAEMIWSRWYFRNRWSWERSCS